MNRKRKRSLTLKVGKFTEMSEKSGNMVDPNMLSKIHKETCNRKWLGKCLECKGEHVEKVLYITHNKLE